MRSANAHVSGIVLAAGRGLRFDSERPKQLLEWAGEPLVRRVVRRVLAARLRQVVVVVGHAADRVERALAGLDVVLALNPDFAEGQSTSVRAGLERIDADARAALFVPADQPFLTPHLIDRLIAAHAASARPIVLPAAAGRRGSPVLWDRTLFAELASLSGDTGGRSLLTRHEEELEVLDADPWELADVDTREDVQRLLARQRHGSC